MPETADRQKNLWGILAAFLMLLLPGSLALQLGLRQEESATGTSAAGKTENKDAAEGAGGKTHEPGASLGADGASDLLDSYYVLKPCEPGTTKEEESCLCAKGEPTSSACAKKEGGIRDFSSDLHSLFALVPEKSWGLDGALESIVRAYESAGYTLVRSKLPWIKTSSGAVGPGESTPGVLLFHQDAAGAVKRELVYLIEETPTGGIREAAFEAAFKDWKYVESRFGVHHKPTLRVLGPTFSGSAIRMGRMLAQIQHTAELEFDSIQIFSGSATSQAAGAALEAAYWQTRKAGSPRPHLEYRTTVRSDEEMKEAMAHYLRKQLSISDQHIAIISESSTVYGQLANSATQKDKTAGAQTGREPAPFAGSMWLPVPYNLGHIQEEWARQGRGKGQVPADIDEQKTLGRLQHSALRRGALPVFDRSTIASRDLSLSALLGAICQQGIQFVGLMLTDPDDKRFLAQRIHLECPDVRLFTFESEIDYLHRADYSYLRGMLVASSYPLYSRNQQWSAIDSDQNPPFLQFARQPDQGVYNAMLFLLDQPKLLQEYAAPAFNAEPRFCVTRHDCLLPPVWISAVGRQGLIPLRAYAADSSHLAGLKPPTDAAPRSAAKPFDLGTVHILLLLVTAAALLHAWAYFRSRYGTHRANQPDFLPRYFGFLRSPDSRPSLYLLAPLVPIVLSLGYLMLVLALRFRPGNLHSLSVRVLSDWSFVEDLLYTLVALLGLVGGLLAILDICLLQLSTLRKPWSQLVRWIVQRPGIRASVIVIAIAALGGLTVRFYAAIEYNPTAIIFLRRSSQTAYELSPLIPCLFLCTVGYFWGMYNLRRLHRLRQRPLIAPVGLQSMEHGSAHDEQAQTLISLLTAGSLRVWLLPGAATLIGTFPVLRRLTTLDHWVLSLFFRAFFFACTLLVVVSLVRIFSGWRLLRTLMERAGRHPISSALAHLPQALARPLGSMVLTELSSQSEREITERQCVLLREAYPKVDEATRRTFEAMPEHERLMVWSGALSSTSHLGANIDRAADGLAQFLVRAGSWPTEGRLCLPAPTKESASAEEQFCHGIQDLLAIRLVAFLYQVLSYLRSTMMFISLSLILMLMALNSYPFQPMQWLTIMIWLLFLIAMSLSGYVLVQMNRDTVVSLISRGQSGGLSWDSGFLKQLAVYILAPLLSLIATKIPAMSWFPMLLHNLK